MVVLFFDGLKSKTPPRVVVKSRKDFAVRNGKDSAMIAVLSDLRQELSFLLLFQLVTSSFSF